MVKTLKPGQYYWLHKTSYTASYFSELGVSKIKLRYDYTLRFSITYNEHRFIRTDTYPDTRLHLYDGDLIHLTLHYLEELKDKFK